VGGFFALILLITIGFYLGRGLILKRALVYVNQNQPGEVSLGQMNLIPLMDFPSAVVQFKDVSWYENPVREDSLHQEPILYIHELYVSLDIPDLIRGDITVEQFRLEDGFVRLEVLEDSVMNLEKALGKRLGMESEEQGSADSTRTIDMERIELNNILVLYQDQTTGDHINIQINKLESQFSYLPDLIDAGVELNIDINNVKHQTFSIEEKEGVELKSHILFNPVKELVEVEPSSLSISGLELETWGMYEFQGEPGINMAFRATNTGLDVLNFLFMGVLDLDEIEQIGSGSIHLDGSISGSLGDELPVVRVNGSAHGLGFRIKTIERDVTDISFALYATNGGKADFSEAQIELQDFSATYPEGSLKGEIRAKNLVTPEVDLQLGGELNLAGLEQMLKLENLKGMEGQIRLDCQLGGVIDRSSDTFLDEAGSINVSLEDVGAIYGRDTLSEVCGTIFMDGNVLGARGLGLSLNGSNAEIEVKVENLLHYLLSYDKDVFVELGLASDLILPGRITRDTIISGLLGKELRGLHFKAKASVSNEELDAFMDFDTLPEFNFTLDSFGIDLPVYAGISDMNASLTFDLDTLSLHYLNGTIGSSEFAFSGKAVNLEALMNSDSGEFVGLDFKISSPKMRAEDLLRYKSSFLLPESYQTEHLEDFRMQGFAQFPVEGLIYDSVDMDFLVDVRDLGWQFRYYSNDIRQFRLKARKKGLELFIDNLEGIVGESNLKLSAMVGNYADSSLANLYGNLEIQSDLLDFNRLLEYQFPTTKLSLALSSPDSSAYVGTASIQGTSANWGRSASPGTAAKMGSAASKISQASMDSSALSPIPDSSELPRLDLMEFPNFTVVLDVGELRFSGNSLYNITGALRSDKAKILYIDSLAVSGVSGGSVGLNGEVNVSEPIYKVSTLLELDKFNINDLDFEMGTGEESYSLKENFAGIVTGSGQADIFLNSMLEPVFDSSTAVFQVDVKQGELVNFAPLKAAGKVMDNKDLDYVRYSTSLIRLSLADSLITIPLTNVESTMGQILIEGEQTLDNDYLYLLRVPPWLVKDVTKSVFARSKDDGKEDEIRKMKMGSFVVFTLWKRGEDSGVAQGDQREKHR